MNTFFGALCIIAGVFVCLTGACFTLFEPGPEAIFGLAVGVALIAAGIKMVGTANRSD